jgi:hypothetical protein
MEDNVDVVVEHGFAHCRFVAELDADYIHSFELREALGLFF